MRRTGVQAADLRAGRVEGHIGRAAGPPGAATERGAAAQGRRPAHGRRRVSASRVVLSADVHVRCAGVPAADLRAGQVEGRLVFRSLLHLTGIGHMNQESNRFPNLGGHPAG